MKKNKNNNIIKKDILKKDDDKNEDEKNNSKYKNKLKEIKKLSNDNLFKKVNDSIKKYSSEISTKKLYYNKNSKNKIFKFNKHYYFGDKTK